MRHAYSLAALTASLFLTTPIATAEPYPYVGRLQITAGNFCPRGWMPADGALLPINLQYSPLFSVIGTTYGGDGRSTFALPDLAGRAMMGSGTGEDLPPRRIGEAGGASTVQLTPAHMPSHTHRVVASAQDPQVGSPAGGAFPTSPAPSRRIYTSASGDTVVMARGVAANAGSTDVQVSLAQPSLGMLHCIAVTGAYPARSESSAEATP